MRDDEVDGVDVDRRKAGDEELAAGRRRERPDLADDGPRLVAVGRVAAQDIEEHDVRAHGLAPDRRQPLLADALGERTDLGRPGLDGHRVERGVCVGSEARIERERSLDALDSADRGQSLAEVDEPGDPSLVEPHAVGVIDDDRDVVLPGPREVAHEPVICRA